MKYHRPTRRFQLPLLLLLGFTYGCATTSSLIPGTPDPQLIDGVSGAQLSMKDVTPRLSSVRHIYVGEEHTSSADHGVQLQVLQSLKALNKDLVLGIEWLPLTRQPALTKWQAEPLNKEAFLTAVGWKKTWGFDIDLYWPILRWAHEHGVPVVALNAPNNLVFGYAQNGHEGLSEDDKAMLPPLDSGNPLHRAFFIEMMRKAAMAMGDKNSHAGFEDHIDAYYAAQLVWDETMAREVTKVIEEPRYKDRTVVVLAGRGHVDYGLGIPERVRASTGQPYLIVSPATEKYQPSTDAKEDPSGRILPKANLYWWAQ